MHFTDSGFAYKIKQIKNALASSNNLLHQIGDAINIAELGQGVYVDASMRFIAPQFKEGEGVNLVNGEGNVILESQINQKLLIMSLGLENMPRLRGGAMSRTCHDAVLFREIADYGFNFIVFGFLHEIKPKKLQIRPITVAF